MIQTIQQKVQAVIFDLGETLLVYGKIRPDHVFEDGVNNTYNYLRRLGQPVGSLLKYSVQHKIKMRYYYLMSNLLKKDFDSSAVLRKMDERHGIRLSDEQWEQLAWLWYEPLTKTLKVEDNILQTLQSLKDRNIKLGVLSNTFVNKSILEKQLQMLGMLDFFPVRLYSYQFDFRKPDSRIFMAAANAIGVKPENIIYVGDRIDKDIKGATAVGMTAVLKDAYTNKRKTAPNGTYRISRLSELPNVIDKINQAD